MTNQTLQSSNITHATKYELKAYFMNSLAAVTIENIKGTIEVLDKKEADSIRANLLITLKKRKGFPAHHTIRCDYVAEFAFEFSNAKNTATYSIVKSSRQNYCIL